MVRLQHLYLTQPNPNALSRFFEPRIHVPFEYSRPPASPADVERELAAYSTVAWFLRFRVVYGWLHGGLYGGLCDGAFDNLPVFADSRIVEFLTVEA